MSVLIKDMEIPKSCNDCEFIQRGYPDWCDLSCRWREIFNSFIRPDWCPLEETDIVKHGRWIYEQLPLPLSDGSKECVRCSVCGTHWDNESNYCPNCGAKMDESEV